MYYFNLITLCLFTLPLFWQGIINVNCKSQQYFWPYPRNTDSRYIPYYHQQSTNSPYLATPLLNYLIYQTEPALKVASTYSGLPIIVPSSVQENCNNLTNTKINEHPEIGPETEKTQSTKQNETVPTGNLEPPFQEDSNNYRKIANVDDSETIWNNQNTNAVNLIPNYYYYFKTPYYFNEQQRIKDYSVSHDANVIREINQPAMENNGPEFSFGTNNNETKVENDDEVKLKKSEKTEQNNDDNVVFYEGVTPQVDVENEK